MQLESLGPYKISKELGRGGMGTVYAATESGSDRPAAVKVLAPQLATSEGFRERFEAEIESLKQLHHPNIVELFGYGQQDHYVYYAMELVEGASLEDELRQGRRFDWREVCNIGIYICRALKLAHDHGIIHRDIKPANLLWSENGVIKLTDFGIARLFGNTSLTSAGGVLGTAEYMAPEQADGRPVTHHCDLYSLGGVLFALLAGRAPFRSTSVLEMLQMQRFSRPEPVRRYAPDTPGEMELIIAQLLEKDPKDRFPNALMVARRLEAMQRGLTVRGDDSVEITPEDDSQSDLAFVAQNAAAGSSVPLDLTADAAAQEDLLGPTRADSDVALDDSPSNAELEAAESSTGFSAGESTARAATHYTTIEEEFRRAERNRRVEHPLISAPTWFLIAGLLATGLMGWYLLQPPSADALYSRISAAAAEGEDQRLLEVSSDIGAFLEHYPDDQQRIEEVRGYSRRVKMVRLERTATAQAKVLSRRHPDSPIGAEYLAAIKLAEIDPERSAVRLKALIDLYGTVEDSPNGIRDFVEAARLQLPRIQRQVRRHVSSQSALLQERLDYASATTAEDPAESRRILEAIVRLYQDKPWAREIVSRAEAELVELPQTAQNKSP